MSVASTEEGSRLPPGYYLDDFERLLGEVLRRSGDLLRPEEAGLASRFLALGLGARRLLVRMLTRKGPCFALGDLGYPEIGDPEPPAVELVAGGFCAAGGDLALEELLPLADRALLAELAAEMGVRTPRNLRREGLETVLLEHGEEAAGRLRERLRPLKPLNVETWNLFYFLFFGNFEQDLSSFVLAGMGRLRFEPYPLDASARGFHDRSEVDFLFSLKGMVDALQQALEDLKGLKVRGGLEAPEAAPHLEILRYITERVLAMEPSPGVRAQRRYRRTLLHLGQAWERLGERDRARACLEPAGLPPARERLARMALAEGEERRALGLCLDMARAPLDAGEERCARILLRRLGPRHSEARSWLAEHPSQEPPPTECLRVPRHPSGAPEQAALEAAQRMGWEGFFAENALWNAFFGLVFWEAVFADVPGAFLQPFQAAPLDLGDPDFAPRRRPLMEAALERLRRDPEEPARLLALAAAKRDTVCAFLHWKHVEQAHLEAALARVPGSVLADILEVMLPAPRAFGSGFPDLFLYRPQGPDWMLWEVKGPGDTLRPEQEAWLRRFRRAGCRAGVVRLEYLEEGCLEEARQRAPAEQGG